MKKLSLIILILSIFSNANSQILKKHPDNKLGLYVTLDLRNSIVDYDFFEYYGLKVGLGNKSLRFGASYHILHRNFFSIITSDKFLVSPTISHHQTNYHLFSAFSELIVHQTPRWELIIPVHFGIGQMSLDAYKAESTHLHITGHDLPFYTKTEWVESAVVSLKANYRIVKWAGLTTGFGYNFAFSNENYIQSAFSAPFYSFGLKLFFDEFGKFVKDKDYRKQYLFNPNFVNN
ncbi:hypothetical protein N9488_00170 [Flavobacteriales bacterium]|jgi:hypothetical protein|nr:hypothetical protein [Flavobacteriales bacterium]MDB4051856.1 hypothetical protein [Flavobacteriales bacterium]MDB9932028.1 hypothetical protein [Flavobacteriales bacterium]MDG1176454.1 hypothetical protein [Flavobacteriales bacterium]|tara:strand:- start:353 stop:1051 length:699 start_codon:yes stop_codon:yes gene_type:complete